MTNLASDRKAIGASVSNLSGLTAELADLLTQGRPYLKADIAQLRRRDDDPQQAEATRPRWTRCSTGCR